MSSAGGYMKKEASVNSFRMAIANRLQLWLVFALTALSWTLLLYINLLARLFRIPGLRLSIPESIKHTFHRLYPARPAID
jgi:hypothetical protein